MSITDPAQGKQRPVFIDDISAAYSDRGKGVIVLTGNTHDLFWCESQNKFLDLERVLYNALKQLFSVVRFDISSGISFYSKDDMSALAKVCARADGLETSNADKIGNLKELIPLTEQKPLASLLLLNRLLQAVSTVSHIDKAAQPICTIVKFAGSLLPSGEFSSQSDSDRQRLVTFLNTIESPWYQSVHHLFLLIADTSTEISNKISALPMVQTVQIDLPSVEERERFASSYISASPELFETSMPEFVADAAGLTIVALRDLLESGKRSKVKIGRRTVLEEINRFLKAELGDIVKISSPGHTRKDIIRFEKPIEFLYAAFKRCENPKTAVPAILVSGPNGGGKTFLLEACAADSGRVVIELAGLRGMYFGQTDTFFEKLLLRIKSYGKILILVDEAHTAFGSVHSSDTHETEKRLAGNVIKMMSDRSLYGKVLWAMMTSRPDELDPDIKSRASSAQIPIFDLEGEERKLFVIELFGKQGVTIPEGEMEEILERTQNYSNRNFDFLLREVLGSGSTSVLQTLDVWSASVSILQERRLQTLIAAQHCTYPVLLPAALKEANIDEEIRKLKGRLSIR